MPLILVFRHHSSLFTGITGITIFYLQMPLIFGFRHHSSLFTGVTHSLFTNATEPCLQVPLILWVWIQLRLWEYLAYWLYFLLSSRLDSSTTTLWSGLFPIEDFQLVFIITIVEDPVFNANSGDPDQTCFAASDLGLHCLPIPLLGIFRLKWVKL